MSIDGKVIQGVNEGKTTRRYKLILFILMLLDYLYTYIGINSYGYIEEGNPIMVWLFELPFIQSITIRVVYGLLLVGLFYYIETRKPSTYIKVIKLGISINLIVIFLHFRWVTLMLLGK